MVFGSTTVIIEIPHWRDQACVQTSTRTRKTDVRQLPRFKILALGGRERDVVIYLPPNYELEPHRRFPVMYMFDGQNLFDPGATTHAATYLEQRTADAYLILPGAATPLANLGYVDAMLELATQVERGEMPRPDAIVLPTGSSGTLAALAIGAAYLGWDTEIIGVRIAPLIATNRMSIGFIARATQRFLAKHDPRWARLTPRFSLFHGAIGPGYGEPTVEAIEGARRMEDLIGVPGEITYSGKVLAGLRIIAGEPRWRGKTLLLWNTLSKARPPIDASARARVPPPFAWMFDGRVPV